MKNKFVKVMKIIFVTIFSILLIYLILLLGIFLYDKLTYREKCIELKDGIRCFDERLVEDGPPE